MKWSFIFLFEIRSRKKTFQEKSDIISIQSLMYAKSLTLMVSLSLILKTFNKYISAFALKCWECNGIEDQNCNDPFDPEKLDAKTAYKECVPAPNHQQSQCVKATGNALHHLDQCQYFHSDDIINFILFLYYSHLHSILSQINQLGIKTIRPSFAFVHHLKKILLKHVTCSMISLGD